MNNNLLKLEVEKIIGRLRLLKNRAAFARKIGVDPSVINKISRKGSPNPTIKTLLKIASGLDAIAREEGQAICSDERESA